MKIKPCPMCKKEKGEPFFNLADGQMAVHCLWYRCRWRGPLRMTTAAAIRAWNKRKEE